MPTRPRLAYILHDLNAWAGQERVTLEVARRLSHKFPVDVIAYTLDDPKGMRAWGDVRFSRVRPHLRDPEGLKTMLFLGLATPRLLQARRRHRALLHAAGACTIASDVIQVHFVHTAWQRTRDRLPLEMRQPPRAGTRGLRSALFTLYHENLTRIYMAMERAAFSPDKTYLAVSRGVARELEEHFGLKERVHVVHHGVDTQAFRPLRAEERSERDGLRARVGIEPEDVVALFVGAFDRKGLAPAIQALGRLEPSVRRRARLMAVG